MYPVIHVGHRMRIAREEAGYEVRPFADALGIAPSTVTRYEKGRARPKRLALKAWAELTDVPAHWLEFGLMEAAPLPPTAAVALSGKGKLPRLDSNQQPAGYRSVASLDEKRERVALRQRAPRLGRKAA